MIAEILAWIAFLVEDCTGIALVESYGGSRQLQEALITERSEVLQDFTEFDQNDCIFQEFDPPENEEEDPKAWRQSLPSFKTSLKECLKTVLLIQTVSGSLIGLLAVGMEIIDFTFAEWCYGMTDTWNKMPQNVQILRVTTQAIEGALIQMWNFTCMVAVFPFSLVKDLHLLALNILAAFMDISYRLYMQMLGMYGVSWRSFPVNALFLSAILLNNYLLARHFYPTSLKNTLKLNFILSAQFLFGLPATLLMLYVVFPWYVKQDEHIKVVVASCSPLIIVMPKVICRLGAQILQGVVHPGTAHVVVMSMYAASTVLFRLMQSELKSFNYFVALGIAHAAIDLVERITITMRDHIWGYLYRLVRRQRSPMPKYRSPRSRRFIADVTIQIMLQEATSLVSVLGFMTIYQVLYTRDKPFVDHKIIMEFIKRTTAALSIDLIFNTISLLIQTRVMNIAVCRVWKKKWRYQVIVNLLVSMIGVTYLSEHLFTIVQDKYHNVHYTKNCSYPSFL